jgi:hypothetical protein
MSRTRNIAGSTDRIDPAELRQRRAVVVDVFVDALWKLLCAGRARTGSGSSEGIGTTRDLELPSSTENASMALRPGAHQRRRNQGGDR